MYSNFFIARSVELNYTKLREFIGLSKLEEVAGGGFSIGEYGRVKSRTVAEVSIGGNHRDSVASSSRCRQGDKS